MKKICFMFLIMIFIIANIHLSFAATPINTLLNEQIKSDDKNIINNVLVNGDTNPIKDLFENNKDYEYVKDINLKKADELSYGAPFKVIYFVDDSNDTNASQVSINVFKRFMNGEKLAVILKNAPYYWELPILYNDGNTLKPVSSVEIGNAIIGKFSGGDWHVKQYPGHLVPDTSYLCSQPDKLSDLLKEKGIVSAETIMHINIPDLYDFIYILSNNKEYFMPITDGNNMNKFTLYSRENFQNNLNVYMQNVINKKALGPTGGFTKTISNNSPDTPINIKVISILLSFIILSVILYYIYNKKSVHKN